jgi:hypothetical protein
MKLNRLNAACAVAAAVLTTACGGDSSPAAPTPPVTTPPPPPVSRVVAQGSFGGLDPMFLAPVSFATAAPGTLEINVDWTFAEDDVDAFLVKGSCTIDQFNGGTCPFAAVADGTQKPERLRLANAEAAQYTLYIGNLGPKSEAVSFQILLTSAAASAGATAREDESHPIKRGQWNGFTPE